MINLSNYADRLDGVAERDALKRLSYGSFLLPKHRLLYVETPKAACSSLKWILTSLEGRSVTPRPVGVESSLRMCIHYRNVNRVRSLVQLDQMQFEDIIDNDGFIKFCVVRNPYARLVSAWADKVRQKEPGYGWTWRSIALHVNGDPERCPTFPEFVSWVVEKQNPKLCNHHWRPMTYLLLPELIRYTYVARTERLVEDLLPVFGKLSGNIDIRNLLMQYRINESLPIDWRTCYEDDIAMRVAEYYRMDFLRYGYSFDSWCQEPSPMATNEAEITSLKDMLRKYEKVALDLVRSRNELINELIKHKGKNEQ